MNDTPPPDNGSPSVLVGRQVDEVCNRFEDAWQHYIQRHPQHGQRPQIEDSLDDLPETARPAGLRELIKLDIDYRRREGENAALEDYRGRFPGLEAAATEWTVVDARATRQDAPVAGPASLTQAGR